MSEPMSLPTPSGRRTARARRAPGEWWKGDVSLSAKYEERLEEAEGPETFRRQAVIQDFEESPTLAWTNRQSHHHTSSPILVECKNHLNSVPSKQLYSPPAEPRSHPPPRGPQGGVGDTLTRHMSSSPDGSKPASDSSIELHTTPTRANSPDQSTRAEVHNEVFPSERQLDVKNRSLSLAKTHICPSTSSNEAKTHAAKISGASGIRTTRMSSEGPAHEQVGETVQTSEANKEEEIGDVGKGSDISNVRAETGELRNEIKMQMANPDNGRIIEVDVYSGDEKVLPNSTFSFSIHVPTQSDCFAPQDASQQPDHDDEITPLSKKVSSTQKPKKGSLMSPGTTIPVTSEAPLNTWNDVGKNVHRNKLLDVNSINNFKHDPSSSPSSSPLPPQHDHRQEPVQTAHVDVKKVVEKERIAPSLHHVEKHSTTPFLKPNRRRVKFLEELPIANTEKTPPSRSDVAQQQIPYAPRKRALRTPFKLRQASESPSRKPKNGPRITTPTAVTAASTGSLRSILRENVEAAGNQATCAAVADTRDEKNDLDMNIDIHMNEGNLEMDKDLMGVDREGNSNLGAGNNETRSTQTEDHAREEYTADATIAENETLHASAVPVQTQQTQPRYYCLPQPQLVVPEPSSFRSPFLSSSTSSSDPPPELWQRATHSQLETQTSGQAERRRRRQFPVVNVLRDRELRFFPRSPYSSPAGTTMANTTTGAVVEDSHQPRRRHRGQRRARNERTNNTLIGIGADRLHSIPPPVRCAFATTMECAFVRELMLSPQSISDVHRVKAFQETYHISRCFLGVVICETRIQQFNLSKGDYIMVEQGDLVQFRNPSYVMCRILLIEARPG